MPRRKEIVKVYRQGDVAFIPCNLPLTIVADRITRMNVDSDLEIRGEMGRHAHVITKVKQMIEWWPVRGELPNQLIEIDEPKVVKHTDPVMPHPDLLLPAGTYRVVHAREFRGRQVD